MSVEYTKGTMRAPRKENALTLEAVDIGGKNTQGGRPDSTLICPHSRSRDKHSIGGPPREVEANCDIQ